MTTKIEWCDITWNPVWGCRNNCGYCYARKLAKRFGKMIHKKEEKFGDTHTPKFVLAPVSYYTNFHPLFIHSNFHKEFPNRGTKLRIFVNSMSDIFYWHNPWMRKVLLKISNYMNYRFLFLTKFPHTYLDYAFPENCYLGVSLTGKESHTEFKRKLSLIYRKKTEGYKVFISFEPLLAYPPLPIPDGWVDWIIVGAQTQPYSPAQPQAVHYLLRHVADNKIPIFMKGSLNLQYKELIQEFPKW